MADNVMQHMIRLIDDANNRLGHAVSWLAVLMVLMCFYNVVSRYVFSSGMPWQQELVRYCHAAMFLLAAGYTLQHDRHVRVDVVYQHLSERGKAWVDFFGTLFLLFPMALAVLYFSWEYVLNSWSLLEHSNEYGGMPGVFVLKTAIWFFAGSLLLQGVALILRSFITLRGNAHG